jgi:hypothetical protein
LTHRSRVVFEMDVAPDFPRFDRMVETSAYRIVQEAITIDHRQDSPQQHYGQTQRARHRGVDASSRQTEVGSYRLNNNPKLDHNVAAASKYYRAEVDLYGPLKLVDDDHEGLEGVVTH